MPLQQASSPRGGFPPDVWMQQSVVISQALGATQVIPGYFVLPHRGFLLNAKQNLPSPGDKLK